MHARCDSGHHDIRSALCECHAYAVRTSCAYAQLLVCGNCQCTCAMRVLCMRVRYAYTPCVHHAAAMNVHCGHHGIHARCVAVRAQCVGDGRGRCVRCACHASALLSSWASCARCQCGCDACELACARPVLCACVMCAHYRLFFIHGERATIRGDSDVTTVRQGDHPSAIQACVRCVLDECAMHAPCHGGRDAFSLRLLGVFWPFVLYVTRALCERARCVLFMLYRVFDVLGVR